MPCSARLRVSAFAFSLVVAVASLTACSSASTSGPDAAPATGVQVATPTPTPTPTPTADPNTGLNQTVTIQDGQGYTASLSADLQLGPWVTSTANSLPGHAAATSSLNGTVTVKNTTSGRNTPLTFLVRAGLEFPAASSACAAQGPELGLPVMGVSMPVKTNDGKYCLVFLTELNGNATLADGQTVRLDLFPGTGDPGVVVSGTEASLPGLIASASKPLGMFVQVFSLSETTWGTAPVACPLNVGKLPDLTQETYAIVAASPGFVCVK